MSRLTIDDFSFMIWMTENSFSRIEGITMKIKTRDLILIPIFSALMVIGAYVKIPFPLVPLTFQPFFCAFAGILLGPVLGASAMIIYVVIGLLGVPVFSSGSAGIGYIYSPTFGYLIGFIAAAYIIGLLAQKSKSLTLPRALIALISGLLVINLIGVPYFYLIQNFYLDKGISAWKTLSAVFFPYFIKDLILYIVVGIISCRVVPILKRSGLMNG